MEIGNISIDPAVLMAPMAGVTDYPYRQILREMGCKLLYTEMVSAKGLTYGNKRTEKLIEFSNKGYIGVQLFGAEPSIMAKAARIIEDQFNPDLIDINMGCPAPKITKNGAGSALMKDPELAGRVTKAVVDAVKIPVTVKIRKGWDSNNKNAVEISKLAEENLAEAVTVHGRTREDYYSGKADWDII
jgi:tRNA-dihydrouridine synthase B